MLLLFLWVFGLDWTMLVGQDYIDAVNDHYDLVECDKLTTHIREFIKFSRSKEYSLL